MPYSDSDAKNSTLFTWTIKNFEICPHQTSEPLKSPEFSLFVPHTEKYHIMLYPRGVNKNSANHVSVYIVKIHSGDEKCNTVRSCEIGIVKATEKRPVLRLKRLPVQGEGRGSAMFLDKTSLTLTDGDLTLYCAMFEGSPDLRQTTSPDSELQELSEAFEQAYVEGPVFDLKLQTKGCALTTHRAMVEAQFPALAKKLNDSFKNIEEKTVDSLLRYLYTGKLDRNDLQLLDLAYAPDIPYHLKSLLAGRLRDIKVETIVSWTRVSFTWNVRDFPFLTSSDVLMYSVFGSDNHSWTWLNVSLTFSSKMCSDDDDVLFSLTRYSRECKKTVCKISALYKSKTFEHIFGEIDCWNIPAFARRGEVTGENSDAASFLFEISLTDGKSTSYVKSVELYPYSASSSDNAEDLESLRNDLGTILECCSYSDVELIAFPKSRNEQRFPCHLFVLVARSESFRKIFERNKTLRSIPIGNFEPEVVESMLRYLYTGRIDIFTNLEQTLDLYELANKCSIPGLKTANVQHIKSSLSVDNLREVLLVADKWRDAELKECVFDFVCTFPKLVLESSRWQALLETRNKLALKIMNKVLTCLATVQE